MSERQAVAAAREAASAKHGILLREVPVSRLEDVDCRHSRRHGDLVRSVRPVLSLLVVFRSGPDPRLSGPAAQRRPAAGIFRSYRLSLRSGDRRLVQPVALAGPAAGPCAVRAAPEDGRARLQRRLAAPHRCRAPAVAADGRLLRVALRDAGAAHHRRLAGGGARRHGAGLLRCGHHAHAQMRTELLSGGLAVIALLLILLAAQVVRRAWLRPALLGAGGARWRRWPSSPRCRRSCWW